MPLNAPSPLAAFQMGQARGSANSPVSSLGQAIKNVVEDARKRGLLQMEQDIKTQGAVDVAQATQPFEREKMQFASDLETEQATAEAGAMEQFKIKAGERDTAQAIEHQRQIGPMKTTEAVSQAKQVQPFAEKTAKAQVEAQGFRDVQTEKRATIRAGRIPPQPAPEIFRDDATGKTMVRNYKSDKNTGQWIATISPASFNLIEQIVGGKGGSAITGGTSLDDTLDSILNNLFQE